jgi:hypothetical protein
MIKPKIPREAAKLLPFRGTIVWPLPGTTEWMSFSHPPINARGDRRKSPESVQEKPIALEVVSLEFVQVEEN